MPLEVVRLVELRGEEVGRTDWRPDGLTTAEADHDVAEHAAEAFFRNRVGDERAVRRVSRRQQGARGDSAREERTHRPIVHSTVPLKPLRAC